VTAPEPKRAPRYVRTAGDRSARKASRQKRAHSRWVCPACRTTLASANGLAWHLMAVGPEAGKHLCPAQQSGREFTQTELVPPKEERESIDFLKSRLLTAERERDALAAQIGVANLDRERLTSERDEAIRLVDSVKALKAQRDALARVLQSILHRFRHSDSAWKEEARAALRALKADNPPTETRGG
jgi:hypothetical protein